MEVLTRTNGREMTLAISGELDHHGAHGAMQQIDHALDAALPPVPGVTGDGFCQCGCHHAQKQQEQEAVQVLVGGRPLSLTPQQRATLLSWAQGQTQQQS